MVKKSLDNHSLTILRAAYQLQARARLGSVQQRQINRRNGEEIAFFRSFSFFQKMHIPGTKEGDTLFAR